jgi:hypothetical protein
MLLAIIAGYLAGTVVAFLLARRVLRALADRLGANAEQRRSIMIVGGIFGAIALAPSIFMAMMIGGGGLVDRYAGALSGALGLGDAGVLAIVGLGFLLIITATVTGVAAIGGAMGWLGARALARHPIPPPKLSR